MQQFYLALIKELIIAKNQFDYHAIAQIET